MERVDIVGWTFKFNCATTGVPKRGRKQKWVAERSPQNLAEMLTFIRAMGYRPEDVAVYDMRTESEYSHTRYS